MLNLNEIKVVVLDNPKATWESQETQSLFCKIIALKLSGYGASHSAQSLSIDTTDFIATHLLLCRTNTGGLEPIMGYKSISRKRCDDHSVGFPALTMLENSDGNTYSNKIIEILNSSQEISYDSAWTILPPYRKKENITRKLKDIFTAMVVHHHKDFKIPQWLGCGVLRLKTDLFFSKMGAKQITPPFRQRSLSGEPVVMMHLSEFSQSTLNTAAELKFLWDQKIIISNELIGRNHPQRIAA